MKSNKKPSIECTRTNLTILLTEKLSETDFYVSRNTFDAMLKKVKTLVLDHAFDYNPYYSVIFHEKCPHFQDNDDLRYAIGAFITPFSSTNSHKYKNQNNFFKMSDQTYVLFLANIYAICNRSFTPDNKLSFKTIQDYANYIDAFIDNFPYQKITDSDQETRIYKTEKEINSLKTSLKDTFHIKHGADVYITYESFRTKLDSCLRQTNAEYFYFMPSYGQTSLQSTSRVIDVIFGCWKRVLFDSVHDISFYKKALSFLNIICEKLKTLTQEASFDYNVLFDHCVPFSLHPLIDSTSEYINNFKCPDPFNGAVIDHYVNCIAEYYENTFDQLIEFYSNNGAYFFSSPHQKAFVHILETCRNDLRSHLKEKTSRLKNMPRDINSYVQHELELFLESMNNQPMIEQPLSQRRHIKIPLSLKRRGLFTPILEQYFSKENIYTSIDNLLSPDSTLTLTHPSNLNQVSETSSLFIPINSTEWNQLSLEDQKKIFHELCDFSELLIEKYLSSANDINISD